MTCDPRLSPVSQLQSMTSDPEPLVSIVLPTHNGARHIDQAIESVACQTCRRWELIVVDDASTDETPAKIAAWAARDARIQSVRLSDNRKLPGALNEGFRRAAGEILTWTSDDNWYAPDALARMLDVLRQKPDIDVVYTDYTQVDAAGTTIGRWRAGPLEDLVFGNSIGACFLLRRRVHERLGGYDEGLYLAEDYDFWLRASLEFSFFALHEPLYYYRYHADSLSSLQRPEITAAVEKAVLRWLPQAGWLTRELRGRAMETLGLRALKCGDVKTGRRHLFTAIGLLRRPPRFRHYRSYIVDWLFGAAAGRWLRRRLRQPRP